MAHSNPITIGMLAHVDAGKTTLSEAILYSAGSIRKLGRVDNQDTFLDTGDMERARGITIFSKQAAYNYNGSSYTLLDTPGHVDFSAETERTLWVLDAAVLVISGMDGVQGHTETLWSLLKRLGIPVFIFVNKMDREAKDPFDLLDELEEELAISVRPLTWPIESGPRFKGVYNIYEQKLNLFQPSKQVVTEKVEVDIHTEELDNRIGAPLAEKLRNELELIDLSLIHI